MSYTADTPFSSDRFVIDAVFVAAGEPDQLGIVRDTSRYAGLVTVPYEFTTIDVSMNYPETESYPHVEMFEVLGLIGVRTVALMNMYRIHLAPPLLYEIKDKNVPYMLRGSYTVSMYLNDATGRILQDKGKLSMTLDIIHP